MSRGRKARLAQIVPVSKLPARENPEELPPGAEVATVARAEFLGPITIREFPNWSTVISYKTNGEGLKFYDTMLGTDSDLAGFVQDLKDDVLHYPGGVRAASKSAEHLEHARFAKFALGEIPHFQNVMRQVIDSYPRGFSVAEKVYQIVERGEWAGAIIYREVIDKPARWFNFGLDRRLYLRTGAQPGELLPQEKFAVVTFGTNNNPWGVPMLDYCYWPWFLKHHLLKNQALWYEKWAQPTPYTEYDPSHNQEVNKKNIEKALIVAMAAQKDQALAIPKGMTLKLLESLRNGSISFDQGIDQLTKMESRLLTGQILTTSGDQGGSYAAAEVHERKEKNRVIMLCRFASSQVTRLFIRDLIDRNFGSQDAYPRYEIFSLSAAERVSEAAVEAAQLKNGHRLSKSWSATRAMIVEPQDDEDALEPPLELLNQPSGAVPTDLAKPGRPEPKVELALAPAPLVEEIRDRVEKTQRKLTAIGKAAAKAARPAFRKIVKAVASIIRGKKSLERIDRAALIKAVQTSPLEPLAKIYDSMLLRPEKVPTTGLQESKDPPEVSTGALLALALAVLAIVERFLAAIEEGREKEESPTDVAEAATKEDGYDIDGHFGRIFEAVHETNIVSISAARLQRQLQNPEFRRKNPYVMIVAQHDTKRLSHRLLDGFILNSDDAASMPSRLPPFGFGCRCRAIPIPAALARKSGLTGSQPVGSLEGFLRGQGATPVSGPFRPGMGPGEAWILGGERFIPGVEPGFDAATAGIDVYTQLYALREKAEEIRRIDPAGWAAIAAFLLWLFSGTDPLRETPPIKEEEFDDEFD